MTKRRLESDLVPALASDVPNFTQKWMADQGGGCLVRAVSQWLQDMVRYYDSLEWTITPSGLLRTDAFPVSAFHGRPLSASIEDFIRKICTCAKLDDSVVLVAAVYLSRIVEKADGELPISSCTVHRLLLQAMTIGAKFTLDHPRSNKSMASFADIPVGKFNQLEVKFLCAIQYDLAVTPADIAIAEGALQINTSQEPVHKKMKMDVLRDNSNQSSKACGVAASTNNYSKESEVDGILITDGMENNSSAEEAANNDNGGCGNSDEIPTMLAGEAMATPDLHNNNSTAASPDLWSDASRCASVQQSPLGLIATPVHKGTDTMLAGIPETTNMSTPERCGSYTLVATAAE